MDGLEATAPVDGHVHDPHTRRRYPHHHLRDRHQRAGAGTQLRQPYRPPITLALRTNEIAMNQQVKCKKETPSIAAQVAR